MESPNLNLDNYPSAVPKATSMNYFRLPSFSVILMVLAGSGLVIAIVGRIIDNMIFMAAGGAGGALLLLVSCLVSDTEISETRHKEETVE